jgi:hypothetical protein
MASQYLSALEASVTNAVTVNSSAAALINGFQQRLTDAIAAALANGATAEELAPVQAEADALKASSDSLAAAVAANTVASSEPTPPEGGRGRNR